MDQIGYGSEEARSTIETMGRSESEKHEVSDERLLQEMVNFQDIEHGNWNFYLVGKGGDLDKKLAETVVVYGQGYTQRRSGTSVFGNRHAVLNNHGSKGARKYHRTKEVPTGSRRLPRRRIEEELGAEKSIRFGQDDIHAEDDTGAEPGQGSLRSIQTDISERHDKELQPFGGLRTIWTATTIPFYGRVRA